MALDNDTRDYVDKKFVQALTISKEEVKECIQGKLLEAKTKHLEGRVGEMHEEIKTVKDDAITAIKEVGTEAKKTLTKKNDRLFEFILLIIVIGFNLFLAFKDKIFH